MEDVVGIINQLQDVFLASNCSAGIELPQIVVVGAQSAGKSSVLENIVGKSFLPRGTSIVTRCPLVLQLVHTPNKNEDFATFQHSKKVFTDYDSICEEIKAQTNKIAGNNKGISHTSINLKIFSPNFVNLTLVDLPGLIKVPVEDQPLDIEEQIRKLIFDYIKNPNSIILAVCAANVDMATSESLKLAREVDPEGSRTLAVLTKLDLMDEGTDALEMLTGKVIPVKLGIIGVVNRSQKDIMERKSVANSLMYESEFLKNKYKSIAECHGTDYLRNHVQTLLIDHIKKCMPSLKDKISQKLMDKEAELDQYGPSNFDMQSVLIDLISKFSNAYVLSIKGDLKNVETKELYGGARLKAIFQESYLKTLNDIDPLAGLSKEIIEAAIKNASGVSATIFIRDMAFERIMIKQIEKFQKPSLKCLGMVFTELNKIGQTCLDDESLGLDRYPNLRNQFDCLLRKSIDELLPKTKEMVSDFIDVHGAYINTSHPDFLKLKPVNANERLGPESPENETLLCLTNISIPNLAVNDQNGLTYLVVQEFIKSYFDIVRKMVQDTVPKYIMHFMVNSVMKNLHSTLLKELLQWDLDELLLESPKVMKKKKELIEELDKLEEANCIINGISTSLVKSSSIGDDRKSSSFFSHFFR